MYWEMSFFLPSSLQDRKTSQDIVSMFVKNKIKQIYRKIIHKESPFYHWPLLKFEEIESKQLGLQP